MSEYSFKFILVGGAVVNDVACEGKLEAKKIYDEYSVKKSVVEIVVSKWVRESYVDVTSFFKGKE